MTAWLTEVRSGVEGRLTAYFDEEEAPLRELAPEASELLGAVRSLTMRGGKRFRPALLFAAYRAVKPAGGLGDVADACAGLELLQSYLLIHDDWMDGDDERRGGPAVHAMFERDHAPQLAASLAILAGNLACTQSWKLLTRAAAGRQDALDAVLTMHEEVLVGQQLDMTEAADVSRMQRLKTGSYTVKGPVALGAALADATDEQRDTLLAYAEPLGVAFQVRDDLLGTFGDAAKTGKPADDLRHGKRTALIDEAERLATPAQWATIERVLGNLSASDTEVAEAKRALVDSGAKASLEARLDAAIEEARSVLKAPLVNPGMDMLGSLADALARRSS